MRVKLLLLLFCVLLSGCYIQSLNKFYTDDLKVELPQIEGEWLPTVLAGDDVSKKNISAWKFTKDKIESYDTENRFAELGVVYFKIGDDLFMDFTAGNPSKANDIAIGNFYWGAGITQTHSLCRLTFKDDNLIIIPLNIEWFADRIKENKLDLSFVKADEKSNYIFTATTDQWLSFLKTYANDKDVFSEKFRFIFKKMNNKAEAVETAKPITPQIVIVPAHTLTVTGAVIVKYDSNAFYYKKQCLSCGYVSENQIGSGYPNGLGTMNGDFTCPKCGNKQNVRIDFK